MAPAEERPESVLVNTVQATVDPELGLNSESVASAEEPPCARFQMFFKLFAKLSSSRMFAKLHFMALLYLLLLAWVSLYLQLLTGDEDFVKMQWYRCLCWVSVGVNGLVLLGEIWWRISSGVRDRKLDCHIALLALLMMVQLLKEFLPDGFAAEIQHVDYAMTIFAALAMLARPLPAGEAEVTGAKPKDGKAKQNKKKQSMMDGIMLGLLLIWKAHRIGVICFLLVAVLDAVAIPATAAAVKQLTDAVTRGDAGAVMSSSGVYIAVIVSAALPFTLVMYVSAIILAEGLVRLQTKISERMIYMEFNESSRFSHEDCQDVFRSDIARMEKLMNMMLKQLLAPFIKLFIALCYVTYVRAEVGFLAMTMFPFIFTTVPDSRSKQASAAFKDASSKLGAVFSNALSCHSMIWHTGTQQDWMKDILFPRSSEVKCSKRHMEFWSGVVGGYITQMLQLFVALHVVILANMAVQGTLTAGDFTGIVALFTQLASPTTKLGGFVKEITKLSGATQSVAEFLATKNQQPKQSLWDFQRNLTRNVMGPVVLRGHQEPEEGEVSDVPVAPGFVHRIKPGSLVSFTSEEGGPMPDFLKLFNGYGGSHGFHLRPENYKGPGWVVVQRLKKRTAVLSKEPSILTGSVRENICFGNQGISEEKLLQAARLAGLSLEDGEGSGSEGSGSSDGTQLGLNFSTQLGERRGLDMELAQRICLARAICRRPSLLLLDQATAGWAPEVEAKFFKTVRELQQTEGFANVSVINNSSHITQAMIDAGFAGTVFRMKDGQLEVVESGPSVQSPVM